MGTILRRMKVIEQILTPDGRIVEHLSEAPIFSDDPTGPHIYHWEEGNMGCDCNRASLCGEKAICNAGAPLYKLNLLDENRNVLYQEFEA